MSDGSGIYRRLQQHLDRQAIGFPATESGVELRLLERCFTPAQAEIALLLRYRFEPFETIRARSADLGLTEGELAAALDGMARAGLIGVRGTGGVRSFRTFPLMIGFWEGRLARLDPGLLADFREYTANLTFGAAFLATALPQMRTIPAEASLEGVDDVAPFDRLQTLVERAEGPITVGDCVCRLARGLEGRPCRAASRLETCVSFGDTARFSLGAGNGREIDKAEALAILRRNQRDGLVLQPSNSQRPEFVCSCCACCCGVLDIAHRLPRPTEIWATNYHAVIDADACGGCGTCAAACQARAIRWVEAAATAVVIDGRCIGCGQCVTACPDGALRLVHNAVTIVPPATTDELLERIMDGRRRG